jgi:SAM-dependent methyltransferase
VTDFRAFERAGWSEAGRAERYAGLLGEVTARAAERVLEAAGVRAGTRVLDVACGTGALVGAAAARGADPVGVDVSPDMVAFARARYPSLRFEVADAEALPFEDGSFEVAVAAFLLHHVAEPERVVRELARVAPRVALAQWDEARRNRLLGVLSDALETVGAEPAGPTGPSREQLARDDELERLLRAAGLADVRVETLAFEQRIADADALWHGVLGGSVNTAAVVRAQDDVTRSRIRAEFDRLVVPHAREGALVVPVSLKIASAGRL